MQTKAAFVAIAGRPSVGKSTVLNALCGHKISIVAASPQTTRNRVRGILSSQEGQLVFVDTPGYHDSARSFNLHMRDLVTKALSEGEVILYVIDTSRPFGPEEEQLSAMVKDAGLPIVVALNKVDLPEAKPGLLQSLLQRRLPEAVFVRTAAGAPAGAEAPEPEGLADLRAALFAAAPEGDPMYPEEFYTDQEPEFRIAEIIREKAIARARQELPHSIYVEVADLEVREEENLLWVRAFIVVERETQRGMLVGRQGSIIKEIGKEARGEILSLFPYRVRLDLRVKVNPKWRNKDALLRRLVR